MRTPLIRRIARAAALLATCILVASCDDSVGPLDPPTLTSISPAVGVQGTSVEVTVTGTNFVTDETEVSVDTTGLTLQSVTVTDETSLTAVVAIAADAPTGPRNLTVTTEAGTSGALTFTINPPPPSLTGITPDALGRGSTTTVSVTGTNFIAGGTTVEVDGSGVSVENLEVTSASSLTMDLVVGEDAEFGERSLTVTTAGGTSGALSFSIAPPAPTLTGLSPTTGVVGSSFIETLAGTGFVAGATVVVSGEGVTVSDVIVISPTSITAQFTIGNDATVGERQVSVVTAGGTSNPRPFQVIPTGPTLTGIAPGEGVQGQSLDVVITGSNFVPGETMVDVNGAGVDPDEVTVQSATSLTAHLSIDADAALGAHDVLVTTPGGTSNEISFEVLPPAPTLMGLTPTTGLAGTTLPVTLTGTHFVTGGTSVQIEGDDVTVTNVEVTSETSLTADFVLGLGAPVGPREVTVETSGGVSGAMTFTIVPPAPTLTGLTPDTSAQGATVAVTLTGTLFSPGATTVNVSGSGVTVDNVAVASATSLTADFVVDAGATLGPRNVSVTTATGGTSGTRTFTVVAPPSITSFTAAPSILVAAQPTRLSWSVADATSCTIDNGVGAVACTGSTIVTPGSDRTYTLSASAGGATATSAATVSAGHRSRFVYVANSGDDNVSMLSIDSDSTLSTIGGGTLNAGGQPRGLAIDPTGRYAYVANWDTDNVSMYTVDPTTGELTSNGTVSASDGARAIAIDPTGRYAYVANQVTLGTGSVSMYTIDGSGKLVPNGSIAAGNQATDIAVDPLGRYVFVANFGDSNVSMYTIDADGTLTSNGTVTATGGALAITLDPTGRYAYVGSTGTNTISMFSIRSTGTLSPIGTINFPDSNSRISDVVADPTGKYIYATDYNNFIDQVRAFSITDATGELVDLGAFATGSLPSAVAVDAAGRFLYVTNQLDNTVSEYSIESDGTLTSIGTIGVGDDPAAIATSW